MADYEQIMQAVRNAHAQGDTASARRLVAMAQAARTASTPAAPDMSAPSAMSQAPTVQERPQRQPGIVERVVDNVVGLDNGVMSAGEKAATALNMGGESLTFGIVGDEAAAGADALMGRGSYSDRLAVRRGQEQQLRQENPGVALAAQVAPAFIPGVGAAGFIGRAGSVGNAAVRSAAVGAAGGATYGFAEGEGGAPQRLTDAAQAGGIGAALGGALPFAGAAIRALTGGGQRAANRAMVQATETVDDLKAMAAAKYDEAARLGITASQQRTTALATKIGAIAKREGVVTPTGRVAQSFPKISDALNMVDDFAQGSMTPEQMQAVRRTFQSAAGSADGSERRLGTIMLREFDDFVATLAPQFREANKLYSRAMNGEMIDQAVELAGVRAGQFTGSGFENALRVEFRRLSRDIVKGRLRGLTQDQQNAIKKIAAGGPMENFMRGLGKAAPTGIVSAAGGGGMSFLIGNAVGGPALGAATGLATMAAGGAARSVATGMQTRNAQAAGALMRSADGMMPQIAAVPYRNALAGGAGAVAPIASDTQRPRLPTAAR